MQEREIKLCITEPAVSASHNHYGSNLAALPMYQTKRFLPEVTTASQTHPIFSQTY